MAALTGLAAVALAPGAAAPSAASTAWPPMSSGTTPSLATPSLPGSGPYQEYVALGDSYSAGPLIEAQRADPLGCLRSTNNYPAFLATYFAVPSFTDVTCSGAETKDMWHPQQTIVPGPSPAPQLDALTPGTDLVTLGIGGNDYGLFGTMISDCAKVAHRNPDGAPCRAKYTVDGVDTKARDARRIRHRVGRVLAAVRHRAPDADVVVLGYPRILPRRGTCQAVPFARGDYRWGARIERILNRSIRRAARHHGARYVDLYPASRGHHACAGRRAWVNGSKIKPLRAANFHPFLRGMRGMAQATYFQMTGTRAPDLRLAAPLGARPNVVQPSPQDLTRMAGQLSALLSGDG